MHADAFLTYGRKFLMDTLDGLDESDTTRGGVCGVWSVKDIVAHLTSFELVLGDVLNSFIGKVPTPYLDLMFEKGPQEFNDTEVAKRQHMSYQEVLDEYTATNEKNLELLAQVPLEKRRETGTIPWYGEEYDLEDMIAFSVYSNIREHCGQICVFKDRLEAESSS